MTLHAATDPRWLRIWSADIDDTRAPFPLSARLARDNGWAPDFAARVVEEYRRFCFLAIAGGREVTPSDEVDQAWHLHILYTEHYWGPWTDALGTSLHHGPTKGGASESSRYWENYKATLALYREAFGEEPPTDIWPAPEDRFDRPGRFQRIDKSRVMMIDREVIKPAAILFTDCLFVTLVVADRLNPSTSQGLQQAGFFQMPSDLKPLIIGGSVGALVTVLWLLLRGGKKRNPSDKKDATGTAAAGGAVIAPHVNNGDADGDGGSGCGSGCGGCGGG